jgi:hypothetical protein
VFLEGDDHDSVLELAARIPAARTGGAVADVAAGIESAPTPPSTGPAISEIAGPREESLAEMATLLAARRGGALRIEGVRNPADPDGDLYENGALLPRPQAILAGSPFEEWLESDP